MINQIRADLYRQSHSLGVAVMAGLTVVYAALTVGYQSVGGIMINASQTTLKELAESDWTVLTGMKAAALGSGVLLYLYLGLFVMLIGREFSQHTYKNTLISGISRRGFILGKYVTLLVDLVALVLLFFATALITGVVAGRPLGASAPELAGSFFMMSLTVAFFISVIFSLGVVILAATRAVVAAALVVALWPIGIALVQALTDWTWLKYGDFLTVCNRIALGDLAPSELGPYLAVTLALLAAMIGASAGIIRTREL